MPPIISIVGKSDSGKTTLIEKLVRELKKRGHRIGVIKHASHGFEIDREGKDSWRHKEAGAETVIVASPGRVAMVKDDPVDTLEHLATYFDGIDLILTEGYKNASKPKIEVFRAEKHKKPVCLNDESLFAFISDTLMDLDVPLLKPREIDKLADMIEERFL
jgi:molybdopterin-guanine dinucleotide biosynthesis protein B